MMKRIAGVERRWRFLWCSSTRFHQSNPQACGQQFTGTPCSRRALPVRQGLALAQTITSCDFSTAATSAPGVPSLDDLLSETSIQSFNEQHRSTSLVEIRKCGTKGWGLYAKRAIPKGTMVFRARALEVLYDDDEKDMTCHETHDQRNSHSVQTGWNRHVIMDLPAILVNHSCHGNLGIHENEYGAFDYLALRDIEQDEEVLWDYETSEYSIQNQFQCSCGAENCRGFLQGFHANGEVVEKLYSKEFVAPYLFLEPEKR